MTDALRHHPNLREFIRPPLESALRCMDIDVLRAMIASHGGDEGILLSEDEREADRAACMARRPDDDLWVFGYGSLIWDPGFEFSEVVRAYAPDWQRHFILKDEYGGRGTKAQPGVMAALDRGEGCHGLAFRIPRELIEAKTQILWKRERIAHAYVPDFINLESSIGRLSALTFIVDTNAKMIDAEMSWEDQVRFCATGQGEFGTSLEYVENLVTHFEAMKIDAPRVKALMADARRFIAEKC